MNYRDETIVAIATPLGVGGVGIVRMSGDNSLAIAQKMCKLPDVVEPNKMYLRKIDAGEFRDKGYCVYFKSPKSFTGQDIVEFQVHGSPVVLESVVQRCIELGAKLANKGEFSQRAFMNGKMSLDEAESLIDLINSHSIAEAKANETLLSGKLSEQIMQVQNEISDILAQIDVSFDYPEHDDETQIGVNVKERLCDIKSKLLLLKNSYAHGKALSNGINVCIVGKPNVGKSSLLNAMLGIDTAIVTDIAGTTTDVIKDTYIYNGIRFNIIDTAGIRNGAGKIENLGIEKSKKQIELADIVLFVVDNSTPIDELDRAIYLLIKDKKHLTIFNKGDLNDKQNCDFDEGQVISTLNYLDIEKIKQKIFDFTIDENIAENDIILVNSRHYDAIIDALTTLDEVLIMIGVATLDCVAVELTHIWQTLGQIVGNTDIEGIIDKIFSKFCLGK